MRSDENAIEEFIRLKTIEIPSEWRNAKVLPSNGEFECLNRSRCGHDISHARGILLLREHSSSVSRRERSRHRLSVPVDNRCVSIQWYLGCKYPRSISRILFLIMPASREFPESEIKRKHNGRPTRHEGKLISEQRGTRSINGILQIGRGEADRVLNSPGW
jgi:hypothetical protein